MAPQRVEGGRTLCARHKMYSAWPQLCVNLDTHFGLEVDNDLPLRVLGHYCLEVSSSSTRPAHPELPFHMTKSFGQQERSYQRSGGFFLHGVQLVGKSLMGSRLRTMDRHRAISDRTRRASKSRSYDIARHDLLRRILSNALVASKRSLSTRGMTDCAWTRVRPVSGFDGSCILLFFLDSGGWRFVSSVSLNRV